VGLHQQWRKAPSGLRTPPTLLGLAPELHSLELAQKMRETIVLPERRVALDDRGVPLGQRRGQLRLQRIDVGRGLIRGGAHA
jgi:hypothetical protein